jgi:isopentenyl diphosphate isomerase/L-lactate dehydrogenase-like FMN-dependent dehydrogenase
VLYGLAAAGRDGAQRAIAILSEETDHALALLGAASVRDLDVKFITR